ncbi:unnamed protein product [Protopolystoma xenopodis]|uniref:Uncharacterized protein n=1 Tax=Protopolystoma xenopodis TaxID=117903 RepID=A0A3S5B235_9PLAT|nr:unnamed protein product [Protopolystoma xenopodis]
MGADPLPPPAPVAAFCPTSHIATSFTAPVLSSQVGLAHPSGLFHICSIQPQDQPGSMGTVFSSGPVSPSSSLVKIPVSQPSSSILNTTTLQCQPPSSSHLVSLRHRSVVSHSSLSASAPPIGTLEVTGLGTDETLVAQSLGTSSAFQSR